MGDRRRPLVRDLDAVLPRSSADAAAGAAHGKGGAHDDRVADLLGKGQRVVQVLHDLGGDDRAGRCFSMVSLNSWRSSALVDGLGLAPSRRDAVLRPESRLRASSMAEVQARLAAQGGQDGSRAFPFR